MRSLPLAVLATAAFVASAAAEEFTWGPLEPDKPKEVTTPGAGSADQIVTTDIEGRKQLIDLQAKVEAGRYDEAINEGGVMLRTARDEDMKTDLTRLLAEALRKKGDWRLALGAYTRLRERFEKGSDEYVRNDAIVEVLRASREGVYPAVQQAEGEDPKTVADDKVLAEALAHVAKAQAEKLKSRQAMIQRARRPDEVLVQLQAAVEGYRAAHTVSDQVPYEPEQQVASTAGSRMAALGAAVSAQLRVKAAALKQAIDVHRISSRDRKEAEQVQNSCEALAKAEETFLQMLDQIGGAGWTGREGLKKESQARRNQYMKFVNDFVVPVWVREDTDVGWY